MVSLQASKFRENCVYCWRGLDTQLIVCICGITLCSEHKKVHLHRPEHSVLYYVIEDGGVSVHSPVLTEEECLEVKLALMSLLSSEDRTEALLFEASKEDCPHVSEAKSPSPVRLDKRCAACGMEENLWVCFTCGYVGCGRKQYGAEGNGHSLEHYSDARHPISVLVSSIGDEEPGDTFCYVCDSFVRNNLDGWKPQGLQSESSSFIASQSRSHKSSSEAKETLDREEASSKPLDVGDYVGIKNLGNTCYISSVVQMLSHVISDEYLDGHFMRCDESPLECLVCQTVRVVSSVKSRKDVPMADFVGLIFRTFPMFEQNVQQDASEFFIYFVNQIKLAEAESKICRVTRVMDYELNNLIECECGLFKRRKESSFFLNIPFNRHVSKGFASYFAPVHYKCKCKRSRKSVAYFRTLPEYLFVIVNRCGKDGRKIKDSLISNEIVVQNFLETIPNAEYIESLVKLGFSREEVCNALVISDNDVDKACNILLSNENFHLRSKKSYKLHSAVCHKGDSITSGHYTWIAREKDTLVHVDDSKVKVGTEDTLKTAYILCYH